MASRVRSQAGTGWDARRPLSWQDFLMNPLGVGLNYLAIPEINKNQSVAELPPATQNPLIDAKGRNVFDGMPVKGEKSEIAELTSKANNTSLASKVNSKETPNSSDPPSSGSTIFTQNKEGEALGVMTRNQRKQWEAANPGWQKWQPEGKGYTMDSVLNNKGGLKDNKAINNSIARIPEGATQNFWDKPLINTKGMQALNVAKLPKGVDLNLNAFNPAVQDKLPNFAESLKMNNAADGGAGVGAAGALKIASVLLNAFNKKKGGGGAKEAGGGSIDQVAVAPNVNFDEFGNLVG